MDCAFDIDGMSKDGKRHYAGIADDALAKIKGE